MDPSADIQNILAQLAPGATKEQILAALMQNFTAGVNTAKETSKTAYQEAIEKIQEYYDQAAVGRGQDFQSNFDMLGDNVANLGMNFNDSGIGAAYAADQQYIQEAADSALATDLAWFEKMQTSQADLYNAMIIEMAAQMALGSIAEVEETGGSSGGGGGGGGGGGRSSSNDSPAFDPDTGVPLGDQDLSITANEDTKYYSPAFDQAVENLYATGDPVNIQMADDINAWRNRVGTGGVVEIMQKLQEENDRLDNSRGRTPVGPRTSEIPLNILEQMQGNYDKIPGLDPWYAEEYNRAKAPEDADFNRRLLDWLTPFNPNHGPVVTLEQVNTDGKWKQNTAENQPMPGWGAQEDTGSWVNGRWERPTSGPIVQGYIDEALANSPQRGYVPPSEPASFADMLRNNLVQVNQNRAASTPQTGEGYLDNPTVAFDRSAGRVNARDDISKATSSLYNVADTLDTVPKMDEPNFSDARSKVQASIDAALEKKRREDEAKRLQEAAASSLQNRFTPESVRRPAPRANNDRPVTATRANPHPMGTGTFGQTVRTGIPFYVAAPKKPTSQRPRTGSGGNNRYM